MKKIYFWFFAIIFILVFTFIGFVLYGKNAVEQYYSSGEPQLNQFKFFQFKFYLVTPRSKELYFFLFVYEGVLRNSPIIADEDSIIGIINISAYWSPVYGIIPMHSYSHGCFFKEN